MFTIGDFARHGRVSPRMLRHYDAIGLLRPARTDPFTGYRHYTADQLSRLNRIIALKDLGLSLEQVGRILADQVTTEELRGMLVLRRAELAQAVARSAALLGQVEARLRSIESEGHMPSDEIVVKSVPAVRVAELSAEAASYSPEDIGPVIQPLYDRLCTALETAGVVPTGPSVAYYEEVPGGEGRVVVHAALTVGADVPLRAGGDFAVVDLPAVEHAATIVHRGPIENVVATEQILARWIEAGGHRSAGYSREVYLEAPEDRSAWVVELQEPLV
ncbi:MerR family transcriptional regulator [Streptomyces yaizuensis]|uniref:MerR family transcriptional regulator n=1 Tax=Streptomyces yaizuensis TaxID=2989713 RepID=A0ABQ5NUM8_9ACTN|nr:MerR family transcriptional regulator [Streptomyces sp. YSPA8]GLF94076.1 MerR family transcriptional regulator [Streptomyces sp. YSPA8]